MNRSNPLQLVHKFNCFQFRQASGAEKYCLFITKFPDLGLYLPKVAGSWLKRAFESN